MRERMAPLGRQRQSVHGIRRPTLGLGVTLLASLAGVPAAKAQPKGKEGCAAFPDHARLRATLQAAVKHGADGNSGMGNQQWAALVDRDGNVCAVAFSGPDRTAQWPGSRAIAAIKASTANALSGPDFALSTGNLFFATQPGQSLYGLHSGLPPNGAALYAGNPESFGRQDDPLVGKPAGGVIVFGGGLPLYDSSGKILGGLGVSGDTACADHVVAWRVRNALNLDAVPKGVAPEANDNLILDIKQGNSASGFGHPSCKGGKAPDAILRRLPKELPTGPKP